MAAIRPLGQSTQRDDRRTPRRHRLAGVFLLGALSLSAYSSASIGATADGARIFWTNSGTQVGVPTRDEDVNTIGVANLDGTGVNQQFITGASFPVGLIIHSAPARRSVDGPAEAYIYWSNADKNTIGRAKLDGTGVNENFMTGLNSPAGLAADDVYIYWSNASGNTIGRANLDGSEVNDKFITGANFPNAVAVDGKYIYWTNNNTDTIGRAKLDGTEVNQNFMTGVKTPAGLAVDGQHIYWTSRSGGTIGQAKLDGTGAKPDLISGAKTPAGVWVTGSYLYWTSSDGTIGRANLDGSGANRAFITGAKGPGALVVETVQR